MTPPLDAPAHNDRALRVLSVLAQSKSAMSAAELVQATGLVKSTLYRQIAVLRRWGFVMETDGRYSPGPVSVQLASGFDGNSDLVMAARADMRALAQQSHESVALVTAVNDRVVCLEMIDSEQSLRCSFDRGRSVPARDGASAKCLLAHMPLDQRDALLDALGESPGRRAERVAELDAIREAGHAVTHGEVDAGVWGASAPVLGPGRRLRGAITLMAPLTRVEGMEAALLHMTVVTAARISRALQ
ncbi:DNA-binding IclR family transcriptional regulator [Variovorax paradoxus]|uniref:DNA-binding IclR family transcriptional regulator n=1 Tax=Variovorax paradoxus TaxID=34073 RepID=A0AAE3XWW7_VARPD|nr:MULTISPECIES: IclR family transcriptional regulator [Variovorax]MBD9667631.1 IclR family transcriptional regulator [Variovorax sp. VRV01]MDP9963890.1 DNA-binding IclR family transcriptional regulator [Variovorax paradoxus]MDR6425370.1 DNA-binding IclR family transcriptional regulator [Variovorax paradoxus]